MTGKLQILTNEKTHSTHNEKQQFKNDVLTGLSKVNKQIPSKYFYDERGSELFNQITRHPDYYLTNCELNIINFYKQDLSNLLKNESFNLIELGPGEGVKTRLLIDQFLQDNLSFTYYTIDVSQKFLNHLIENFDNELPTLETVALNSDYLNGIKWLGLNSKKRNFLLFLGSSIGNYHLHTAKEFLQTIRSFLHPGDYLFIGFDLLKDVHVMLKAYNDRDGITREFNLNLLRRINNELGANFNLDAFYHYGTYNVYTHAMESYLLSNKAQIVYIEALNKSFGFKKLEPIHVETSQKYCLSQIEKLAYFSQCNLIKNYKDPRHYFVNSLWQVT
ncbi:L-histidine N(alpha)-methyltransferase [Legionella fairfieldensis]|uniref:L-histidine N(alpha)-methyltransferase n=1 Tax=Legionella fairfieldensis TaxID=45064 RepID=UPI0006848683|nr:L-histidine N(alpha)-methyltransferase [Legionella fairfieldensis]